MHHVCGPGAINGVPLDGQADWAWLDRVEAAGNAMPPSQPRYMQVVSSMPYFQPNHLITVGVPPGSSVDDLGLDAGPNAPPKLAGGQAVSPLAQSLGCQPGDVVVQATIDGAVVDATRMSADELRTAAKGGAAVQLTLLQPKLTPDNAHRVSWPMGGGAGW